MYRFYRSKQISPAILDQHPSRYDEFCRDSLRRHCGLYALGHVQHSTYHHQSSRECGCSWKPQPANRQRVQYGKLRWAVSASDGPRPRLRVRGVRSQRRARIAPQPQRGTTPSLTARRGCSLASLGTRKHHPHLEVRCGGPVEVLERAQVGITRMRKFHSGWANAWASDLPQGFQYGRNSKLGVLPGRVPRKTDKVDFNNDTLWRSHQFQAHRLVDDPEVALKERQRLAEILRARRDIKKDPSIARICLLREMKPESAVVHRLCSVVQELGLPDGRDPMVQGTNVACGKFLFRQPRPMQ